jgi:bacillolysin
VSYGSPSLLPQRLRVRSRPLLHAVGAAAALTLVGSALPAVASPVTSGRGAAASQNVVTASGNGPTRLEIGRDQRGRTHFVGARAGRTVKRPASVSATASPATKARAHLGRYGQLFGVGDPKDTLRTGTVDDLGHGQSVVRFQQMAQGLPVLGGQLATVVDARGNLVSMSGEASPRVSSSSFTVTPSAARRAARTVTAKDTRVETGRLRAARPARWLYDASLFSSSGAVGARAVWLVQVTARHRVDVRELVLVDAATGRAVMHVNQVPHLDQVVCDNGNKKKEDYQCSAGRYKSDVATSSADTRAAYLATRAASDFYASLGVDLTALIGSNYGDGKKLRSTVRVCPTGCPYDNAFWDGSQMVYGEGFPQADDVVAHELTHGVTQHTSGLIYWFQSGAINESMSDVFGEFIDETDGLGTDGPAVRWQLGEGLPHAPGVDPVSRSMANPPAYDQPDRVGGTNWVSTEDGDSGGVHTNSGVGNKAAFLITDGTPMEGFGGQVFPGLGIDKAKWIYWLTETMLTPGADYADLSNTLYGASSSLALTGTAGITPADCETTVKGATTATQMGAFVGPSAPQNVRVQGGYREIKVSWSPPAQGAAQVTSYVLIVTPGIDGENFLSIDDPRLREVVVGGIPAGRTFTFALAAVSGGGTSPPVSRALGGTSLSLTTQPIIYGGHAQLTVRLTSTRDGAGVSGRTVRLYRKLSGASSYRLFAKRKTSPSGTYTFRPKTTRKAKYYAAYSATSTVYLGSRSPIRTAAVRPRVSVAVSDRSVRVGKAVQFSGKVTPRRSGWAALQRRRGEAWRTVLRDRLDGSGRYRLTVVARTGRDYDWRVVMPATRAFDTGVSRTFTVCVT